MSKYRIAYFISPHGFGHATRASGVISSLYEMESSIQFEIFTHVPQWLFSDSLSAPYNYHSLLTDIGIVQKTSLHEDIPKTLKSLDNFLPFNNAQIKNLAELLNKMKCTLIICDIAPMGLAIGKTAGIPSLLIENFTWDWIYQTYTHSYTQINKHIIYLKQLFNSADFHIQTEPVCCYNPSDLITLPLSRKIRTHGSEVREKLEIPINAKLVIITMGGISEQHTFLNQLMHQNKIYFVIPGGSQSIKTYDNVILLPQKSGIFHPDLINASDAVIGKVGYSTLAEVYHAGVPFGYITRANFRESDALASYIKEHMNNVQFTEKEFQSGNWTSHLEELLSMPRILRSEPNGAEQAAQFIYNLLKNV